MRCFNLAQKEDMTTVQQAAEFRKQTERDCSACTEYQRFTGKDCPKHQMETFWKELDLKAQYLKRKLMIRQEVPSLFDAYRDQELETL